MKRRVASLPPVAATAFNEKVVERREQNAVRTDPRDLACEACRSVYYTTETVLIQADRQENLFK